jgi:hypothetical protein
MKEKNRLQLNLAELKPSPQLMKQALEHEQEKLTLSLLTMVFVAYL